MSRAAKQRPNKALRDILSEKFGNERCLTSFRTCFFLLAPSVLYENRAIGEGGEGANLHVFSPPAPILGGRTGESAQRGLARYTRDAGKLPKGVHGDHGTPLNLPTKF